MMIGWHSDTEDSANFYEFLAMTPDKATGFGAYNSGNYSSDYVDSQTVKGQPGNRYRQACRNAAGDRNQDLPGRMVSFRCTGRTWPGLRARASMLDPVVNALNFPYLGDLVIK